MPRIRTIKPEFWQDFRLAEDLTRDQRLFYIALWNESDDEGRFLAHPRRLLGAVFPYDRDLTEQFIEDSLKALAQTDRVVLYEVGGEPYAQLTKFQDHQRVNRPTPSKIPAPPTTSVASLSTHGGLSEESRPEEEKEEEVEGEVEQGREPTNQPSAHARLNGTEEEHVSLVIRLANRGMSENPAIDTRRFRPILPQHGKSRQAVAEWRAAGIDWPTIEATVLEKARKYEPNDRYRQITTLGYFTPAITEEHEKRAAADAPVPEIPTGEQAETSFKFLGGDPSLQEWAARVDRHLRAALEDSQVLAREVEQLRAHLRRLNEQDFEFKRLKASDQEAFLWVRVLNWYGERVGDPRPAARRLAAVGA